MNDLSFVIQSHKRHPVRRKKGDIIPHLLIPFASSPTLSLSSSNCIHCPCPLYPPPPPLLCAVSVPHSIAVIRSEIGLCSLSGYNTVLIRLIPWACPCPCVSIILYSLTKCRKLSTLIGEKQHHPTLSLCVPQSTACLPVYERGIITTGHPLDLYWTCYKFPTAAAAAVHREIVIMDNLY